MGEEKYYRSARFSVGGNDNYERNSNAADLAKVVNDVASRSGSNSRTTEDFYRAARMEVGGRDNYERNSRAWELAKITAEVVDRSKKNW